MVENTRIQIAKKMGCSSREVEVNVAPVERNPTDATIASRKRGDGAEVRVVVNRSLGQGQQTVGNLIDLRTGGRLGGANFPPPTKLPGVGVETGDIGLRMDVAAAHGDID